ncbi:VCBS domain-containing protein, partial [Thiotrichales bacterium 19S9-11]|nr:VCBS domain-containing protein [Thiotrichales bacterium 19S9-11]
MTATDADADAVLTFSTTETVDGFSLNSDGSYSFDPSNNAYDSLDEGDTQTITIPVTVTDENGATDTENLVITLTGTNDAPVVTAETVSVDEGDSLVTGTMTATDADADAVLTFSTTETVDGFSLNSDGSYSFDPSNNAYDSLAEGDTQTITIPVTVTDEHGATNTENLVITLTGTNDVPTVTGDVVGSVTEDTVLTVSGDLDITDLDTNESLFNAGTITGNYGSLLIAADGVWTYTLDNSNSDVQALNDGENLTDTISVTTADGTTQDITITINGTNDNLPIVAVDDIASTSENTNLTIDVLANDENPNASELMITNATINGSNHGSVTIIDDQLVFSPGFDFDYLAAGESENIVITYTISDGYTTSSADVTVTVTGTNDVPVAVDDLAEVETDDTITIDVLANDTDLDINDNLTIVSAVLGDGFPDDGNDGDDSNDNAQDNDASVTIVDNQLVFDPGHSFDNLAPGETQVVTITYTIEDDTGAQSTATATVTIFGPAAPIQGTNSSETLTGTELDDTIYGEKGDDTIYGLGGDDTIYGGNDDDIILGGIGNDLLYGEHGDDEIFGGEGDDIIIGGKGGDIIDGGAGTDTLSYETSSGKIIVNLDTGSGSKGDAKDDIISNIENVIGSDHDDTITGDSGDNVIRGGKGDDTVYGLGGEDTYVYQAGDDNDYFHGGAGSWIDTIELQGITEAPSNDGDWSLAVTNNAAFEIDEASQTITFTEASGSGSIMLNSGEILDFDEVEKIIWTA